MEFSICIDVDDVERAIVFYGRGVGLTVVDIQKIHSFESRHPEPSEHFEEPGVSLR